MRAGTLDTRIALQRKAQTLSSSGSPIETWSTLVERWAASKPVSGDERNASQQWIAREQVNFTIRWSADVDTLSPLDRVICPAEDASNSPLSNRSIYDIISVQEVERSVRLVILAARRVA